jgi:phosphate uptake regulator
MYINRDGWYVDGVIKRDRNVDDAYFSVIKKVNEARSTGGYALEVALIDAVGNVMSYNEEKQ